MPQDQEPSINTALPFMASSNSVPTQMASEAAGDGGASKSRVHGDCRAGAQAGQSHAHHASAKMNLRISA